MGIRGSSVITYLPLSGPEGTSISNSASFHVAVAGAAGGKVDYVDQTTGFNEPGTAGLNGESFELQGFSVAIVTFP